MRVMWSMTIRSRPPDLADHLEPERALGALLEPTHDGVDRSSSGRRSTSSVISSISMPSPRPMSRTLPPHTIVGIDGSSIIGTLVHRPAEPARHLDRVRLVVGRVVEDLLAVNGPDPGAQSGGDHRERVVAPARVDPADEQRRAALLGGRGEPLHPLRRCGARVVERVQRRRDDVRAGAQAPFDVGDGLLGPDVAGRHVGDGVAVGQRRVDVGGRRDPGRAVQPGERRPRPCPLCPATT